MSIPAELLRLASATAAGARRRRIHASTAPDKPKVIVLSGPTGSGKSNLALRLANLVNGEIINADSVQVYRTLDVGSAKPPLDHRRAVPHHLLDILDPSSDYSVGQFFSDARAATNQVLARGRTPIVVGGTGLYLRWFIHGKPPVPPGTPETAAVAAAELSDLPWPAAVDLVAAAGDPLVRTLPTNDWYRLRRRLEIVRSSGSPSSSFPLPHQDQIKDLDYDFLCFFLSAPRMNLYRSIDRRCEEMIAADNGLLLEAHRLLGLGLRPNTVPATRAIGYRHAMEYLVHCRELKGESSREDFVSFLGEFQKASRNFAKRQMTWFRAEPVYRWLDTSRPMEEVMGLICDAYWAGLGDAVAARGIGTRKVFLGRRESVELKGYQPELTVFAEADNCDRVLDWIRWTQCMPIDS